MGVAQALIRNKDWLASRVGTSFDLRKVLVKDLSKSRQLPLTAGVLTDDPDELLGDADIGLVVEVMGGYEPATGYIRRALESRKDVVTANKEVIAKFGPELLEVAQNSRRTLLFEGSVGAGIPIIGPLTKDLAANQIHSIYAIINGTTNFILSSMENHGMTRERSLELAQSLGYAEADPTNDVDGIDASYKLAILATLAFQSRVHPNQIFKEGIGRLDARDFLHAKELGYSIKSLAIAKKQAQGIEVRVHPALIPEDHMLAKVSGAFNAVAVEGDLAGNTVFIGQGAGQNPTTSAVLGDLVELGRNIVNESRPVGINLKDSNLPVRSMTELETMYYYRLTASDRPGVLSQISQVLGDLNISIASVIQKDSDPNNKTAELVITTHPAKEEAARKSVACLTALDVVEEINNLIRMEDLLA
ncbi:homoserine dehydrogenase [SAR202 cluster bacterium AD-804-J14_MRT_500m]|nr:homoserine dehydrogenase [SAR202 cluster bacterium AD-804-J14_MRT_500m]